MKSKFSEIFNAAVIVSALGYFVDLYDLLLFSIVRVPSLRDLGLPEDQVLASGVFLINWQMLGLLLGGIFWGVLGDKQGRVSVLFGSILLYSLANIANAFVQDVNTYALLRFVAGIGLAGELGAAVTLVSEVMSKESRGYGTMVVAGFGILGAVVAGLVGDLLTWRAAYIVGGVMGLLLLFLRVATFESGIYKSVENSGARRGDLRMLFTPPARLKLYLSCILIGVPIWFVIGILITFSPELAKELGVTAPVQAGRAVMFCYMGAVLGDILSGGLSQILKTRKKIFLYFLLPVFGLLCLYIFGARGWSDGQFYTLCFFLGTATGYWTIFVTTAAEHFGTNLRATVTTTAPNFVRGSVVLFSLLLQYIRPNLGLLHATFAVGLLSLVLAAVAYTQLEETYGKDLNYLEQ